MQGVGGYLKSFVRFEDFVCCRISVGFGPGKAATCVV